MNKLKAVISILVLMTEFWYFGIFVAGGFGALTYLATNDSISAFVVFIWASIVYFAIEYTDVKTKLKSKK